LDPKGTETLSLIDFLLPPDTCEDFVSGELALDSGGMLLTLRVKFR